MVRRQLTLQPEVGEAFSHEWAKARRGMEFPITDEKGVETGVGRVVDVKVTHFGLQAVMTIAVPDHLADTLHVDAGRLLPDGP